MEVKGKPSGLIAGGLDYFSTSNTQEQQVDFVGVTMENLKINFDNFPLDTACDTFLICFFTVSRVNLVKFVKDKLSQW